MTVKSELNKHIIAFVVSLALFMDALDTTIINTAIPAISRSLNVNPVDLKIALLSYLITLAIFIPVSGWIADKFGVKRVFLFALAVFTASSFWCGNVSTLKELVVARSAQGLGGSLMLPLGRLILLRTFHRHELVSAMNQVVIVISMGLMLGPLAGGFITYHFSWEWIFLVNVPAGILTILCAAYWFEDVPPKHVRPFDFIGFVLFGGGLAAITFALSDLSESTASRENALLILCIGVLMLTNYFLYSRRQKHPIIDMGMMHLRTFNVSIFGNLLARLGFGGVPFLLPLLLQVGLGYSAQLSGLLLVPLALGVLLVKSVSLPLLRYFGYRRLLLINTFFVGFALWSFQIIDANTSTYAIAFLTFLFGLLISLQFSGINSLAYADLDADHLSSATSIISTMQQIAQSFGVACAALLLRFYASRSSQAGEMTPVIFHETFFAMGLLTFFSALIFLRLKPHDGHQMLKAPQHLDGLSE